MMLLLLEKLLVVYYETMKSEYKQEID